MWIYDNRVLEIVSQFNHLVTFRSGGAFRVSYQTLIWTRFKAMHVLIAMVKLDDFKPDVMCQLFDVFASSTICYGTEIWGFNKLDTIERVLLKYFNSRWC
jgi:hypothetical protein